MTSLKKLLFITLLFPVYGFGQWSYVNPAPTPDWYISMNFVDSQTGFALGTDGNLARSSDGGRTWIEVKRNRFPKCYCTDMVFTTENNGLITGAAGMILKTTDGGVNWDSVDSGTGEDLRSVCMVDMLTGFITGNKGVFLRTGDGGVTWDKLPVPGPGYRNSYDCHFTSPLTGFIACGEQVLKTNDGGVTWTICLLSDTIWNFRHLAFNDMQHGFVTGARGTLFRTADGGVSWTRIALPVQANLNTACFPAPQLAMVAGSSGALLRSLDGGISWHTIQTGFTYDYRTIAFSGASDGCVAGALGAISHTGNSGASWQPVTYSTLQTIYAVDFADASTGFAAGQGGTLLKTEDGGASWSLLSSGITEDMTTLFTVNPLMVYAGTGGDKLVKSTNGGISWMQVKAPPVAQWSSLYFSDPNRGYITGNSSSIYKTENGGATWSPLNTGTGETISSVCFEGNTGLACGSNGIILKSSDGGLTWTAIQVPEFYKALLKQVVFAGDQTWYVIGNMWWLNSNIMYFGRSTSNGETWEVHTFDFYNYDYFNSVAFTDIHTGYIAGSDFIIKTTDGGRSWIDQTPAYKPAGLFGISFADDQTGCCVGYYGQIIRTTNGGGLGIEEPAPKTNCILGNVYPNPAADLVHIPFTIKEPCRVTIEFLDLNGELVWVAVDKSYGAGEYRQQVPVIGIKPGLYICRLRADGFAEYCKLVIRP